MRKFADRLRDLELRVQRLESELELNEEAEEAEEAVCEEDDDIQEDIERYVIVSYRKASTPPGIKTLFIQSFDEKRNKVKWVSDGDFARFFYRQESARDFLKEYEISPPTSNHQKPRVEEYS